MTEKQPKDYVPPEERVEDPRYQVAGKVVSALAKPGSVLLFIVLVLAIIGISDWIENSERVKALVVWMERIEDHRAEEMQQCQNNLATIVDTCLRELGEPEK